MNEKIETQELVQDDEITNYKANSLTYRFIKRVFDLLFSNSRIIS